MPLCIGGEFIWRREGFGYKKQSLGNCLYSFLGLLHTFSPYILSAYTPGLRNNPDNFFSIASFSVDMPTHSASLGILYCPGPTEDSFAPSLHMNFYWSSPHSILYLPGHQQRESQERQGFLFVCFFCTMLALFIKLLTQYI